MTATIDDYVRTRLRKVRKESGVTQAAMAKALSMTQGQYSGIETGRAKAMRLDCLVRAGRVLRPELTVSEWMASLVDGWREPG